MKKYKVSVVVAVYNVSKYIKDCIESILKQTYPNLEIILVDDGSTDDSYEICKMYCKIDKRIFVYKKINTGVSDTRNFGINKSTGELIMFLDSDDTLHPNCIEYLIQHISKATWPLCRIKRYNMEILEFDNVITKDFIEYEEVDFILTYRRKLLNSPVGRLYFSDIIKENHLFFDKNLSLGEDLLFNLKYIQYIKKIIIVESELYNYRLGNINSLGRKYRADMKKIQLQLLSEFMFTFSNTKNKEILYLDSLNFITTIISNELHSKKNILKRFFNVHEKIKDKDIQKQLQIRKPYLSKMDYFLLNHFYVLFLIKKKRGF